jgi:hypothetical protein
MERIFQIQPVTAEQSTALRALASVYASLESVLSQCAAPSREMSLALTNLEQSAQWARQAVLSGAILPAGGLPR